VVNRQIRGQEEERQRKCATYRSARSTCTKDGTRKKERSIRNARPVRGQVSPWNTPSPPWWFVVDTLV